MLLFFLIRELNGDVYIQALKTSPKPVEKDRKYYVISLTAESVKIINKCYFIP